MHWPPGRVRSPRIYSASVKRVIGGFHRLILLWIRENPGLDATTLAGVLGLDADQVHSPFLDLREKGLIAPVPEE